jgi:hypothetical protein
LNPDVSIRTYSFQIDRSTRIIDCHVKGSFEGGFLKTTILAYYLTSPPIPFHTTQRYRIAGHENLMREVQGPPFLVLKPFKSF